MTALSDVSPSQANKPADDNKQKIIRQVAQKWIDVGIEQYQRGYYKAAEQSFLRAQDYEGYLTSEKREALKGLLAKTHEAATERKRILRHIQAADALESRGRLIEARTHLEKVKDSKFLAEEERKLIVEGLRQIDVKLGEQKIEIAELYDRSVGFYGSGRLEEAREGFIKAVESGLLAASAEKGAKDYLVKIDNILVERAKPPVSIKARPEEKAVEVPAGGIEEPKADKVTLGTVEEELLGVEVERAEQEAVEEEAEKVEKPAAIEPEAEEVGYIEVVKRNRNIRRSRTEAVVNDAVAKAQRYISEGEFGKAKEVVETAERTVNEYQLDLGDELFIQYSSELKQLSEKIIEGRSAVARQLQEQKQLEAIEAQRRYREQTEADRKRRIAELMDSATAYQKQQKYPEALGQLEYLLKMDPLNDKALILEDTLKDIISFREQLELEKEKSRERVRTLFGADEAMIPYADVYRFPKNWREIVASPYRKPEEAIGQDPTIAAVYKQLDEIVDLTELAPEVPFSEAIEELKNSVEPPLKISPAWGDLRDNSDIDQTTPINMDAISAIPLGTGLELLLERVAGGFVELGYVVGKGGVITIATVESLPSELKTFVYDITDLTARPAAYVAQPQQQTTVSGGAETAGGEGFQQQGGQQQLTQDQLEQRALDRTQALVLLIQETILPDSWYNVGGEGMITIHENKKLIVYQSLEVHNQIEKLLNDLRKSLGHQVSIEARFLLVGENFLEDIGLDVDITYYPHQDTRFSPLTFGQSSSSITLPESTGVPGSFGGFIEPVGPGPILPLTIASQIGWTYNPYLILDPLRVSFLLRATQAHRDSLTLTAPKVTVLSGESATLQMQKFLRYAGEIDISIDELGDWGNFMYAIDYEDRIIITGTLLNITPIIMHDKKNVLLNIVAQQSNFLGMNDTTIQLPVLGGGIVGGDSYTVPLPETEVSQIQTRVSVPDGGTLLLGGQKISVEVEREAGVPVLSKIPFIGRLFSNRSMVKDEKVLLILVKPTIILQDEAENKAFPAVAMERGF
jgi:general secretion pathway protein D